VWLARPRSRDGQADPSPPFRADDCPDRSPAMPAHPLVGLAAIGLGLLAVALAAPAVAHDRPSGPLHKTRSAVHATHGLAATSQPLATQAALRVLQEGGNAIDAALAANAVLGVVEPMSCGVGGDLFALVWDAKTKTLHGLNASGRAPAAATLAEYRRRGLDRIPTYGPLSWSVPGCVDGWEQLRARFGTRSMGQVLAPAIALAEGGFPVSEIIAADWKTAEGTLLAIPTSAACFLPGGQAPGVGDVFRNPDLARTLRLIAEGGPDAFYRGPIAAAIDSYSRQVDGLLRREDLARHASEWVEPVSTNYRGYDVWQLPPNGQGLAVLQMLNVLERHDLKTLGWGTPETLHLMLEAKKLAYEDRARFYVDPAFAKLPLAGLISKEYAARRAALIDPERAAVHPTPGDPPAADTVYLCVVDKDRNAVSLIQSNFHGFGSGHVPGMLGFPLQNRGALFALDPAHPNRLEPGKRPFHTIIPGFVTKAGQPWLTFGVMGGDMQPQGQVQVLTGMIDFGMDPQEAGDAPRWRHEGSSAPTGQAADPAGGTVFLESGFGPAVRSALEAKGHVLAPADGPRSGAFGGYQAIRLDAARGTLVGGSDPRKDGAAAGY
jgi:gamma-glutamyltranspeptidase/glutathione hydrolase